MNVTVTLSELDRLRFGLITAQGTATRVEDVQEVFLRCSELGAQWLILRINSTDLNVLQEAEKQGAFVADTLLYFEKRLDAVSPPELPESVGLRAAVPGDAPSVARLAAEIFRDYPGHYLSDPRLPRDRSNEVYSSWAERACRVADVADTVLLLERAGEIIGFSVLKITAPHTFDCRLIGISPSVRRQGAFSSLLRACEHWGVTRGLDVMEYSTQLTNVTAQRGLCKAGFLPTGSRYTLHKWFV